MRPLGLAYISAYLHSRGRDVDTYDFSDSLTAPDELVRRFDLAHYRVVGLSFYNVNALLAFSMAQAIKEENPRCVVVAGGPHATAADVSMLRRHPEIDVVVRNEGEVTFLELVNAILRGDRFTGIQGLSYRANLGEPDVICEPDRARIDNLDELPAPIVTFRGDQPEVPLVFPEDPEPYLKRAGRTRDAVAMITSRSCPYNCSFCAIIIIGRQWRAASAEKVAADFAELDKAAGNRYQHVYFLDANFFVNARRAVRIGEALQRTKPGVTFSFATRANQVIKGKTHLERLRELGLRSIEIGIESASPQALERYAKDVTPEQNEEALEILRSLGIKLGLDFIMFDAESTITDLRLNLEFFERNGLDTYVPWESIFTYMTPYLGTPIRTHYEQLLARKFDEDILPDPASLIIDPIVRQIFNESHKLCSTVPMMQRAVETLEQRCLEEPWSRETARMMLNAATLRRFYFCTLYNLVDAAETGRTIRLEDALPRLTRDDGALVNLREVIDYALQRD